MNSVHALSDSLMRCFILVNILIYLKSKHSKIVIIINDDGGDWNNVKFWDFHFHFQWHEQTKEYRESKEERKKNSVLDNFYFPQNNKYPGFDVSIGQKKKSHSFISRSFFFQILDPKYGLDSTTPTDELVKWKTKQKKKIWKQNNGPSFIIIIISIVGMIIPMDCHYHVIELQNMSFQIQFFSIINNNNNNRIMHRINWWREQKKIYLHIPDRRVQKHVQYRL